MGDAKLPAARQGNGLLSVRHYCQEKIALLSNISALVILTRIVFCLKVFLKYLVRLDF